MGKLINCNFKGSYDTNFDDNVLDDFYIPALSASTSYDRMTGFFSSSSLACAARGIKNLIENGGKMRILTSPYLTKEDVKLIESQYSIESSNAILTECMSKSLSISEIEYDNVQALGWLLKNNLLEIRVVLVHDENGELLDADSIDKSAMFHNKIGIFKESDTIVTFNGSINETLHGWIKNIESFEVFCNWKAGFDDHGLSHIMRFESYWKIGSEKRSKTIAMPEAIKRKLIVGVPDNKYDLKIFKKEKRSLAPRNYQLNAIDNWIEHDGRGIFNMATGTGKTLTAAFAVKKLFATKQIKCGITIIAVPYKHLIEDPWKKTIDQVFSEKEKNADCIFVYDNSNIWKPKLHEKIHMMRHKAIDSFCVIGTYDSLSSNKFVTEISSVKERVKITFVGDEVHNVTDNVLQGLLDRYDYRLGLSATPARYFDDDGTQKIVNYFGDEVYTFSLYRAIQEKNPDTGKTYLTPYKYYPVFVNLELSEIEEYRKKTKSMAKIVSKLNEGNLTNQEKSSLIFLRISRALIIKKAKNKVEVFKNKLKWYKENNYIDHTIVYCSSGSDDDDVKIIDSFIHILNENKITNSPFTSKEDKPGERQRILKEFDCGELSVLVAMKCLDEGVDVPSTRNAIVVSSNGNPREYIQRRGRVLRRFEGKDFATIFDFIVTPGESSGNYIDTEINVFKDEYKRFYEFSKYSLNHKDNMELIMDIVNRYNIDINGSENNDQ